MKYAIRIITGVLMAAMVFLALSPTAAEAVPPMPSSFYGTVKLNGSNVPDGTKVFAWIGGVKYCETETETYQGDSVYSMDVPGDDPDTPEKDGGVEGETIVFKIAGYTADQTGTWHSGTSLPLNLTAAEGPITITPTFTPTPTNTPTRTPTPTPTGPRPTPTPTPTATRTPMAAFRLYLPLILKNYSPGPQQFQLTAFSRGAMDPVLKQMADGSLWLVGHYAENWEPFYTISYDGGQTWSEPQLLWDFWCYDMDMAQDPSGRIWVAWSATPEDAYDIFYRTTEDSGHTWSPVRAINVPPDHDTVVSVVPMSSTETWICWEGGCVIIEDGGQTWSDVQPMPVYGWNNATYTRTSDSRLWIAKGGMSSIMAQYSSDGGQSWSPLQLVTSVKPAPSTVDEPIRPIARLLEDSGGDLWLAWYAYSSTTDTSQVWIATSTDNGVTWSSPRQITMDPSFHGSYFSNISIAQIGNKIWVVYASDKAERWQIYGRIINEIKEPNLVMNSDFELGLEYWSNTGDSATYLGDSQYPHGGLYCAKGIEVHEWNLGRLYQDVTYKLEPGKQYRISGWIRTEDVEGSVVIGLDYVGEAGWTPGGGYVKEIGHVTGTTDWTYYESDVFTLPQMPSDAVALWFLFDFNSGKGTAWWDDVKLLPISTVFFEDFNDGTADGWIPTGGNWVVENGEYSQSNTGGVFWSWAGDTNWTDYSFSAKVRFLNPQKEASFGIRSPDSSNVYYFCLAGGANALTIAEIANGQETYNIRTSPWTAEMNRWYEVEVVVQGDNMKCYLDDDLVFDYTDSGIPSRGRIGLRTYFTHAHFDDILVTALP